MTLRRHAPLALALAALAVGCQPKIDSRENPAFIDFVAFDLSKEIDGVNTILPQPNAISLANAASLPVSAQRELLEKFIAAGGFPWEQEVAITIDFSRQLIGEEAEKKIFTATTVDTATVTASTIAIVQIPTTAVPLAGAPVPVAFDAAATTFTAGSGRGTLALHKPKSASGSRAWTPGAKYAVFVRGGANGVRVTGGGEIHAWPTMQVILSAAIAGKSLTDPANQGLLSGTPAEKAAAAARLEPIRQGFASLIPIATGMGWAAEEIASIQAFDIAPAAGTVVVVDSGSGIAPLPFDVAREAIPANTSKGLDAGLIKPNTAFGAAGAGLVTLDGFSTTAMILAQTSGPITASTVAANVKLYKRSGDGTWAEVTAIAKQPANLVSSGFSTTIGLQPAVWAGTFPLPPLAENTKYAVVVTDGVKDVTGTASLVRSTFMKLLLEMSQPVVAPWPVAQGTSPSVLTPLLAGMDGQTAAAVQKMRSELDELIADEGLTRASIVAAYTFKTQTVTATSVSVTAAPYGFETTTALFTPGTVTAIPPDTMAAGAGFPAGSFPNVESFYTTTIDTPNGLDVASGFLAVPQNLWLSPGVKNTLSVLVAAPVEAATTGQLAPLVVFHHGITRTKEDLLALANSFTERGFVVAAIDAPYHGSRSFCSAHSDCDDGGADGVCTPVAVGATLASVPGTCTTGTLKASASGNYFVSSNFFRTRDAIRQDLMDQSALVLALARPPSSPAPAANDLATALAAIGAGYAIDPTRVYFVGQSLGGIIGAEMLATNPRIARGVLNVAGGTLTDIFTNAPDFRTDVEILFTGALADVLAALGLPAFQFAMLDSANPVCNAAALPPVVSDCYSATVAAAYLKTVNVAKWILDPADPINYAASVETGLPSLLDPLATGLGVTSTQVFGMAAQGDTTIPNAYNYELYGLAGIDQATYVGNGSVDGALVDVSHGFLLDPTAPTVAAAAQADAADFLETLALPTDELAGTTGVQVILP